MGLLQHSLGLRSSVGEDYRVALVPALRRVDGVRMIVGVEATRAEVYGVGHRHPVTIPVSVGLAARLVAIGAPLTMRVQPGAGQPTVMT